MLVFPYNGDAGHRVGHRATIVPGIVCMHLVTIVAQDRLSVCNALANNNVGRLRLCRPGLRGGRLFFGAES